MSSIQTLSSPIALCVLGMHRSGTSALARLVNLLGVELGRDLIPKSKDNPRGFWEHRAILNTHDQILDVLGSSFDDYFPLPAGWNERPEIQPLQKQMIEIVQTDFFGRPLWGFKDPRTCRLLPMWKEIFPAIGVQARYVILIRSPEEIARSLTARDGYAFNKSLLLTLTHLVEAEVATRGLPRVVVSFDRLLADWKGEADKIEKLLGKPWPRSAGQIQSEVSEFLDPSLRHHSINTPLSASAAAKDADLNAVRWISELHEMLLGAQDDVSRIDSDLVDRIRNEFAADRPRLGNWRAHRSLERGYMALAQWGANLDEKWQAARDENNWLKLAMAQIGIDPSGVVAVMKAQSDANLSEMKAGNIPSLQLLADQSAVAAKILTMQQTIERMKFEAEGAHGREALQKEKLQWLDIHVPRLEAEIARLKEALVREIPPRDAAIERLKKWTAEITASRDWAMQERDQGLAQIETLKKWAVELETSRAQIMNDLKRQKTSYENLQKWAAELETAKIWLADQRTQLLAELQRNDQLVSGKRKAK